MTTIINAVNGTGLTQSADGSGIVKLQSDGKTTNALAWVNFNGTNGTVNAQYNITSVTRNAACNYTLNLSVPLTNLYPAVLVSSQGMNGTTYANWAALGSYNSATNPVTSTTTINLAMNNPSGAFGPPDPYYFCCAIFGN